MRASIDVHVHARRPWAPAPARLRAWALSALSAEPSSMLSIRVVGACAARRLNARFRGRDYATNVLSFPGAGLTPDGTRWLGDVVICAPVVAREARAQRKDIHAHWAHMTVHGVLHLLGFDHLNERDARHMEAREVRLLSKAGFANPYRPCSKAALRKKAA